MNIAIKPTYLLLASVIALAACSQEDMPGHTDGDSRMIVFATSLPELTARAEETTKGNMDYFQVTAFDLADLELMPEDVMKPLFGNERVAINANKNAHTSPFCCWPDPKKESHRVSFFGFYPGLDELAGGDLVNHSTAETIDYQLTGFRVATDIANQVDFVTAYASGSMADNLFSGIELPFVHQLSRIEIKAYGAHKSCDIEIAGVRIGGVGVESTFDFKPVDGAGGWTGTPVRDCVEYVYRKDDKIFTCGENHRVGENDAVSIMGTRSDGKDNCAMLIPSAYAAWDYAEDPRNGKNQMYISVLIRVTDATPTAGVKPAEKQRYPYLDLSQGADALKHESVYFAVDKETNIVSSRLEKDGDKYLNPSTGKPYDLKDNEVIKAFGWAALPVTANWAPGKIYTYTLDYTHGVGLHDPAVTWTAPGAGDPVISDRVGLTYTVKEWEQGGGSGFIVPGS